MTNPNPFDLEGKVIIITGGAGLLGQEYAKALALAGARVVVADLDKKRAEKVAATVNSESQPGSIGVSVNVADKISVQNLVSKTLDEYGRIDGLVNNAALDPKFTPQQANHNFFAFENYPLELWDRSLAVNVTGMFLCAQAVAPAMLAQKQGVIINVSSMYGLVGPDQRLYEHDDDRIPRKFKPVDYSVTKSAVLGLTHYLAAYWAGKGIRVNTLTPGGVFNDHEPEFVRRYSARTPMGRMAHQSEYCGALIFLLSEASSYMTGSNLVVDGGWTAW